MKNKKSISLPEELLVQIEARAAEQNRTLSNYMQNLVRRDLNGEFGRHGPIADAERIAAEKATGAV
jgi:hypothetical protein